MATATSVTQAQQLQLLYKEDEAQLLLYLNAMKAALQDALKEKQKVTEYHEATRQDWSKKLRARHKEVNSNRKMIRLQLNPCIEIMDPCLEFLTLYFMPVIALIYF